MNPVQLEPFDELIRELRAQDCPGRRLARGHQNIGLVELVGDDWQAWKGGPQDPIREPPHFR
jgi:hypothetical protein